jgi:Replication-relaxation
MTTTLVDTSSQRRPRFRRSAPPPLRLTSDDLAILRHVGEHRFLRSSHLVQLIERSPEKIIRRLGALYHNGYLDRPHAQLDYFTRSGSAPLIYALGNKGAAQYAAIEAIDPPIVDWTDKNRDAKRPYIEHALLIADLMIALERAVRAVASLKLLRGKDLLAQAPRMGRYGPQSWTMDATVPGESATIAVTPDKVFALEFVGTGRRNYFLVEADRATMPIERTSLAQSSFKKKLLAYYHGHAAKRHTMLWGIPGFRVLTITSSKERIVSMIKAVQDITDGKGSNVFLFANADMFESGDPLSLEWLTGKGQRVRLAE